MCKPKLFRIFNLRGFPSHKLNFPCEVHILIGNESFPYFLGNGIRLCLNTRKQITYVIRVPVIPGYRPSPIGDPLPECSDKRVLG